MTQSYIFGNGTVVGRPLVLTLHKIKITNSIKCYFVLVDQIARAPCGSGTVSRVAMQVAKGLTDLNQPRFYKSRWGSSFIAKAVEKTKVGDRDAVRIEVSGQGHYIGKNMFFCEENDVMGKGFMVD